MIDKWVLPEVVLRIQAALGMDSGFKDSQFCLGRIHGFIDLLRVDSWIHRSA